MTTSMRLLFKAANHSIKAVIVFSLLLSLPVTAFAKTKVDDEAPNSQTQTLQNFVVPEILNNEDIKLYTRIFARQKQGRWKDADKLIPRLNNKILLGHVQAQRYLHPTAYRSKYKELKTWLAQYADHPQADIIYKLALQRRPKNHNYPQRPVRFKSAPYRAYGKNYTYRSSKKLSKADRTKANRLKRQLRRNILNTRLSITEDVLKSAKAKQLLDPIEMNETYARLAAAWYYYGKDKKAYQLAVKATQSRKYVPSADWIAGLAAWRLNKTKEARDHFAHLAKASRSNSWMRSSGAYWAARANLKLKEPQNVSKYLYQAAEYPRTFYGILARRSLGLDLAFNYQPQQLNDIATKTLRSHAPSKRALALIQLGKTNEAKAELSPLIGSIKGNEVSAFLQLTEHTGMPELAFRLGARLAAEEKQEKQNPAQNRGVIDAALYPIPKWEPEGGFEIDRALVFAFMRQESSFNPNAKSPDGARGLLQLMPQTASYISRDQSFRGKTRNQLFDPSLNLALGQKYLGYLLNHNYVEGDLFKLATAYNGGPGNLGKWERKITYNDDPLLFIESLPSHETRLFIERVLTNLWIYRARLDQYSPSLDTLAAGRWPRYEAQDQYNKNSESDIAENAKTR
ncbi:lytic transglycosylase domain-containing protein [Kiloniella sp. EL199]|uniref:lytic transglycosylase domain-containing protein n=1 Tax=Kiloniella sp. EL199 TaxID=2107581 RepID=UPI000EA01022|nr:lytic transglycosylase domain-containing protein [Kiloniella sp. EL199]